MITVTLDTQRKKVYVSHRAALVAKTKMEDLERRVHILENQMRQFSDRNYVPVETEIELIMERVQRLEDRNDTAPDSYGPSCTCCRACEKTS